MLKFSDNPPMLCPWAKSVGELQGRWWLAHTKARFEKVFASDLLRRAVGYFLPMSKRVTYSSGKKRVGMVPLFTSYVFFNGTHESRSAALATNRLCRAIEVADGERLTRELVMIEAALLVEPRLNCYGVPAIGERCRIRSGPFAHLEGKVVERAKLARIVLEVSFLGQGAVIEIDADLLERLG